MSEGGERRIALAAVAGAHGVKGEVRLKLFGDSADSLAAHEKLYVAGDERRVFRSFRYGALAEFFILDGRQYRSADAARVAGGGLATLDPFGYFIPFLRDQRFIDVIIKKGVLIVENRSRKDGVINCQDRAVAWHVYVASNVGMPPNQKISGPSEA